MNGQNYTAFWGALKWFYKCDIFPEPMAIFIEVVVVGIFSPLPYGSQGRITSSTTTYIYV